jgi:acetylornithine deacetylase
MESAMWEGAGVPTVVCGPAGGGLHADVEWVELDQLRAYAEALAELIPAFTGMRSSGPAPS